MKKFTVVVHYEGAYEYTVEAEREDLAREIASGMFADEDPDNFLDGIDWEICDSWEEK